MATTPEGKVKQKLDRILKRCGYPYLTPTTGGYGSSGWSDRIVCVRGDFIAIEVKAQKGKPTELQWKRLREVADGGGWAAVVNETNVGDVEAWLQDFNRSVWFLPAGMNRAAPVSMRVKLDA